MTWTEAQQAYRRHEIGDDEFLAAKRREQAAQDAFCLSRGEGSARQEIRAVFGREAEALTATQMTAVADDVAGIAEDEGVSLGYAANLLYHRVHCGNLASYARTLAVTR